MSKDRNTIKWAPFNSVINGKYIINSLTHEKSRIKMPILSNDEINDIEEKILDAYFSNSKVLITYFDSGYQKTTEDKIKKIDQIYKIIYLNNKQIRFNQIINILLINY